MGRRAAPRHARALTGYLNGVAIVIIVGQLPKLLALGVANLVVGLGQGFPGTDADSRTAVNDAVGGRSQLAGMVAAAMLPVPPFLTAPPALVPTTALAAVILASAVGLLNPSGLRRLWRMGRRAAVEALAQRREAIARKLDRPDGGDQSGRAILPSA